MLIENGKSGSPIEPLQWYTKRLSGSVSQVLSLPGIYVIGHTIDELGLAVNHVFVYVGKTANLHHRSSQHDLRRESNPQLVLYLRQNARVARI